MKSLEKDIECDNAMARLLETLLLYAKNGQLRALALIAVREDDAAVSTHHTYKPGGRFILLGGMEMCKSDLVHAIHAHDTRNEDLEE